MNIFQILFVTVTDNINHVILSITFRQKVVKNIFTEGRYYCKLMSCFIWVKTKKTRFWRYLKFLLVPGEIWDHTFYLEYICRLSKTVDHTTYVVYLTSIYLQYLHSTFFFKNSKNISKIILCFPRCFVKARNLSQVSHLFWKVLGGLWDLNQNICVWKLYWHK